MKISHKTLIGGSSEHGFHTALGYARGLQHAASIVRQESWNPRGISTVRVEREISKVTAKLEKQIKSKQLPDYEEKGNRGHIAGLKEGISQLEKHLKMAEKETPFRTRKEEKLHHEASVSAWEKIRIAHFGH
jgi:hypothetical protein